MPAFASSCRSGKRSEVALSGQRGIRFAGSCRVMVAGLFVLGRAELRDLRGPR